MEDLSKIKHVAPGDPVAAEVTSQPTRAIELRLKQLQEISSSASGNSNRLVIPNVRIASSVALYNTVYFDPNTDQFEQGLAGVTVKSDTFTLNPSAVAVGIVVARKSSTVADVMVGGFDTLDTTKLTALLETGEIFQPGVPLYLSAREPGKLTRFAPNFKVQVALTSDSHFIVNPVYSDPDAVEVVYRNQLGMRPVGSIRLIPAENVRYQIVGFDALENYDIGDATAWRTTFDPASTVDNHKSFGYCVADSVVTKQPKSPVFIKIEVARTTGAITCSTADAFADLESDTFNVQTLSAPNNLNGVTFNNVRTYVVTDRAGATLGTLSFKFTDGDISFKRRVYFEYPDSFQGWKMVSDPSEATAVATIGIGNLTGIDLTDGGTGWSSAPTVQIIGGGGTGAQAVATTDGNVITSVTIIDSGSGYTSTPAIAFVGVGTGGTATAYIDGVVSVEVTHGSFGYSTAPSVVFTGGGGSGATAEAVINDAGIITAINVTFSGGGYTSAPTVTFTGMVVDLDVTNGGTGYISAPTVTIAPPPSGTTATAIVNFSGVLLRDVDRAAGGVDYTSDPSARVATDDGGYHSLLKAEISTNSVVGIPVTSAGSGYNTPPQISFSGGGGCAAATASVSGGGVVSASVSLPGKGYTSLPLVLFHNATGTGAEAVATLKAIQAKVMLGGEGYLVGDSITLAGGTFGTGAVVQVASVTSANGIVGEITAVTVLTPGSYSELPGNLVEQDITSGVGVGANFRVFWGVNDLTITDPGSGYVGATTVSFANGGQVRATPIMDSGDGIDHIVISHAGAHFTSAPTVVLSGAVAAVDPVLGAAVIDGDGILSLITITDPGIGFGQFGPGGVERIVIRSGGTGYTATPAVVLVGDDGSGATATAFVSGGKVTSVLVTAPGNNYRNPPVVTFVGGNGSGAEAAAYLQRAVGFSGGGRAVSGVPTVTNGSVTDVQVTAGGTGYSASFPVSFIGGGGSGATATAFATAGVVTSVLILTPGSGYTTAPAADFSAGLGTGATATVTISLNELELDEVVATTPGSGYSYQPRPVFTAAPGGGAEATASVLAGAVTSISVDNGGSRFTVAPIVILSGGGGSGAKASASITNGVVTSISVDAGGTGYSSAPTVSFSMGAGAEGETRLKAVSATVLAAGAGYAVSDTITVNGGDPDSPLILDVVSIGFAGDITAVAINDAGSYKVVAPNGSGQLSTSGTGVGATFAIDWGVEKTIITAGGQNYPTPPIIGFCGGGQAEAYFVPGGEVLSLTIDIPGDGYTSPPTVSFTGGGGTGAAAVATISGDGGSRSATKLQIRTYHDDYDDNATVEFPAPNQADFFYNLFADPVAKSRWPSVPTEKTTFLMNGLETLTGVLNEGTKDFDTVDCDVGLSRKAIYWTTNHIDACPWDRFYETFRREPGTGGTDNILPGTGDDAQDTNFRWWEHTYKYEPNRNKGWLYINRLSRFHQSGRVVSLAVESPLQLINLENGQDSGGRPLPGQLLLRLNNQTNILSAVSPQIDMSTTGTVVAIYQNLTGRNVMLSSVILTTIFQLTGAGSVVTANNARITIGTQAGNFRNIIGNLNPNTVTQAGRDCNLIDQNQVKELFPDEDFAYSLIAPNEIVYLKVDEAAGGPIQSQIAVARLKGHVL